MKKFRLRLTDLLKLLSTHSRRPGACSPDLCTSHDSPEKQNQKDVCVYIERNVSEGINLTGLRRLASSHLHSEPEGATT